VKAVAVPALAHRLTLRPELWVQRIPAEQVVRDILEQVPTPAAEDVTRAEATGGAGEAGTSSVGAAEPAP
jgi:MoxR-like ATPase